MESALSMFVAPVSVTLIGLGVEYFIIRHRPIGTPSAGIRAMLFLIPIIGAGLAFALFSYDFWMGI